jgi:mRNA interferase MazF
VAGFDQIIDPSHSDFRSSGLKTASLIRLGYLVVLPADRLLGVLGSISSGRHGRLLQSLSDFLKSKESA